MLGKLLKNSEGKFFLELPDSKGQPGGEAMSPQIREDVDEEVEGTSVAAVAIEGGDAPEPKADASVSETDAPATPAPKAAPDPAAYVDPDDIIKSAIASISVAPTESGEAPAPQPAVDAPTPTFAEAHLVNAGNKVARRRPGMSMGPFMNIAQNMRS